MGTSHDTRLQGTMTSAAPRRVVSSAAWRCLIVTWRSFATSPCCEYRGFRWVSTQRHSRSYRLPPRFGDGPPLFVKREDLSSPYYGGNKVRTLEAHMGSSARFWRQGDLGDRCLRLKSRHCKRHSRASRRPRTRRHALAATANENGTSKSASNTRSSSVRRSTRIRYHAAVWNVATSNPIASADLLDVSRRARRPKAPWRMCRLASS